MERLLSLQLLLNWRISRVAYAVLVEDVVIVVISVAVARSADVIVIVAAVAAAIATIAAITTIATIAALIPVVAHSYRLHGVAATISTPRSNTCDTSGCQI
jgi:hypothetical protein